MAKRSREEDRMQETIVAWCRNRGLYPIHVPNETPHARSAQERIRIIAKAKRRGMQPGVPDLLILESSPDRPDVRGVALELKTGRNQATQAQRAWMDRMRAHGWVCEVVRSKDEAVRVLTDVWPGLA